MNYRTTILMAGLAVAGLGITSCSKETPAPEVQSQPTDTPAVAIDPVVAAPPTPTAHMKTPTHQTTTATEAKPKGDVFDQANDAIDQTNKTVTKTTTVVDRAAASARRTDSILRARH